MPSSSPAVPPQHVPARDHASVAMVCGTVCFISLLGASVYLSKQPNGGDALHAVADVGRAFSWLGVALS